MLSYNDIDFPLIRSTLILLGGYFSLCGFLYFGRQLLQGAQGDHPANPLAKKSGRLIGLGSMSVCLAWFAFPFTSPGFIAVQLLVFLVFYLLNLLVYAKQRNEDAMMMTHGIACGLLFAGGFGLWPAMAVWAMLALLTRIAYWLWLQPPSAELGRA